MCRTKQFARNRTGGTSVEFAVVAPLFFLLVIGSIQLFQFSAVCNSVENAVMEGVRKGILAGTSDTTVRQTVDASIASAGLSGHTVSVNRTTIDNVENLSVQVSLSLAANGFLVPSGGGWWTIQRQCSIRCE